jgi:hypothetical protein
MEKILPVILILSLVSVCSSLIKAFSKEGSHLAQLALNTIVFIGSFFLLTREDATPFVHTMCGIICFVNITPLILAWYFQKITTDASMDDDDTVTLEPVTRPHVHSREALEIPKELLVNSDLGGTQIKRNVRVAEPA